MRKIKVLHVIESLTHGGAERRLVNDLTYLDKERFENRVCCLYRNDYFAPAVNALGVGIYYLEMKGLKDIGGLSRLKKIIKEFNPDILHTQLFGANIYGRLAGKLSGVKNIVTTLQYPDYEKNSSGVYSAKRKFVDALTGRLSNKRFVAVSEYVRDSFAKELSFRNIDVIYNSVDTAQFSSNGVDIASFKKGLGIENSFPVMLNIGRLVPQKGQKYLVEAFAKIKGEYSGAILLLVGTGPCENGLRKQVKSLGLEESVKFLGVRLNIKELLAVADLFVFPTLMEGLALTLIEAMAAGKICVASDIGPNKEVIEDNITGFLCKANDPEDIALAIKKALFKKDDFNAMGIRARESVRAKFDAKLCANKLEKLYLDVIARER